MAENPTVYRLPSVSFGPRPCGYRFPNPRPDRNLPTAWLTCTCEPGHEPPHVAHCGDLAVAIAVERTPAAAGRPVEEKEGQGNHIPE